MNRSRDSDDDDDDELSRPSSLSQTQRFTKSGNPASRDLKMTSTKSKYNEVPVSSLNLKSVHDRDSLSDSDDDTTTKTGRSTSSATPSQLTPKPRERSFLRGNLDKPKAPPRRIDVDDDDHHVFGQTMKPSPRQHHISTLREDEERDQSFAQGFREEKKRKSPDLFATDSRSRPTVNSRKFHSDQSSEEADSDDESFSNRQGKSNHFRKSPRSPTDGFKQSSRKNSSKSRGDSDRSDDEHSSKQFTRHDYTKKRSSNHDLGRVISILQS